MVGRGIGGGRVEWRVVDEVVDEVEDEVEMNTASKRMAVDDTPTATSDAAPIPQPPPLQPPLAVRAPEAARLLGISERALWTLTRSGEVPHVKVGRATIYAVDHLRTWLADHAKKSTRRSVNRAGKEAAGS